jgi:hypothetical protein
MDELVRLLEDYLHERISPKTFNDRFFVLWSEIGNEQHNAIKQVGEDRETTWLASLLMNVHPRFIPEFIRQRYTQKLKDSYAKITDVRIQPLSEEDHFLSALFTPMEHYEPDPEVRGDYYSDEIELKQEIDSLIVKYHPLLDEYGFKP